MYQTQNSDSELIYSAISTFIYTVQEQWYVFTDIYIKETHVKVAKGPLLHRQGYTRGKYTRAHYIVS